MDSLTIGPVLISGARNGANVLYYFCFAFQVQSKQDKHMPNKASFSSSNPVHVKRKTHCVTAVCKYMGVIETCRKDHSLGMLFLGSQ